MESINGIVTDDAKRDNLIIDFFDTKVKVDPIDEDDYNDYNDSNDSDDSDDSNNSEDDGDYSESSRNDIKMDSIRKGDIIIGIDLGTSNSAVCVWRNNNYEIIPDEFGENTIPSIVAFTNKSRYIGYEAKNQRELNPKNVIFESKRLIGRKITDECVMNESEFLTYDISGTLDGNILLHTDVQGKKYTPEEISAMILTKLKTMASEYMKEEITKAVITVPANFTDSQRQATKDAATIAGLECIRIINEPTAAAIAYGLYNRSLCKTKEYKDINIIVYDFGGGTLDVSALNVSKGLFEVLASVGNTHLGGADFDQRLMRYSLHLFKKKHNINVLDDVPTLSIQKLRRSCENAKKILSSSMKSTIAVKDFYKGEDLYLTVTRDKFIELCRDLLLISMKPLDDVLKSANLSKYDIDEIILVGGMTRIPMIRENIKMFFDGKDPNCSINPDEAVAIGAGIEGYRLSHEDDPFSESVTLLDIVSLSLGVETIGGVMNTIIKRNTIIPVTKSKMYTTDSDFETSVLIKIFEGERKLTKDNYKVGEFELKGIEPAPRGSAKIQVKFNIDINGIITVTAKDTETDSKTFITITGNKGRLSQEKIQKLVKEAKENELKDKIERLKKQYYYEIDDLCSNIRFNTNNNSFNVTDTEKARILEDICKIEKFLQEKMYMDHTEDEYKNIIEKLKKNYGILILKKSTDGLDSAKGIMPEIQATSIYGDDEDEDNEDQIKQIFEKIEEEELGIEKMAENGKQEIKQMRDTLKNLCNDLFDVLTSKSLKIPEENIIELREIIDDTLLWTHINQKATKIDYKAKIDNINKKCEDMMKEYDENEVFSYDELIPGTNSLRDELEELCYLIKSSVDNNMMTIDRENMITLENKIDNTLKWLIDNPLAEHECCRIMDDINSLFNSCSKNTQEEQTKDLNNSNHFIDLDDDEVGGTSIHDIKNKLLNKKNI